MNKNKRRKRQKQQLPMEHGRSAAVWTVVCLFFIALMIKAPSIPIKYIGDSLRVCAFRILPTLFPFLVISELLIRSGGGVLIGRLLGAPAERILGLPRECGTAILLGALCGAPIGVTAAMALYERGATDRDETERLLPLCAYPSAAFTVGSIGAGLYGDGGVGLCIHLCVLAAGLTVGALFGALRRKFATSGNGHQSTIGIVQPSNEKNARAAGGGGIELIPAAISSAAESAMRICAVVIFFSCILGCSDRILSALNIPATAAAMVFSFFELTFGSNAAAGLQNTHAGLLICTAASAWMGLSIHLQVFAIAASSTRPRPRLRGYLAAKTLCAPLAAAIMQICTHTRAFDGMGVDTGAAPTSTTLLGAWSAICDTPTAYACISAAAVIIFAIRRTRHGGQR